MDILQAIADYIKTNTTWTTSHTTNRMTIHNDKDEWLGTIYRQVNDVLVIPRITNFDFNFPIEGIAITIPLADPEIISKIIQIVTQDFATYQERWPCS